MGRGGGAIDRRDRKAHLDFVPGRSQPVRGRDSYITTLVPEPPPPSALIEALMLNKSEVDFLSKNHKKKK